MLEEVESLTNQPSNGFQIEHHDLAQSSSKLKLEWWEEEVRKSERCGQCWLRSYDCICAEFIDKRRIFYEDLLSSSINHVSNNFKVLMYYHYQEIGRSANTAHILEALLPPSHCQRLTFTDWKNEQILCDEIYEEIISDTPQTIILYPSANAVLLSEWMKGRKNKSSPVRLVALDGTYSQASRQFKYLSKSISLKGDGKVELPVVKLDLEQGKCISAYAGIQHQPNQEKICSYQAVVMALQQLCASSDLCSNLFQDLDTFIKYLLQLKVKLGKKNVRSVVGFAKGEFVPKDFVQHYIKKLHSQTQTQVKIQTKRQHTQSPYSTSTSTSIPIPISSSTARDGNAYRGNNSESSEYDNTDEGQGHNSTHGIISKYYHVRLAKRISNAMKRNDIIIEHTYRFSTYSSKMISL